MIPEGNITLEDAAYKFLKRNNHPVFKSSAETLSEDEGEQLWAEQAIVRKELLREFAKPFVEGHLIALVYDPEQKREFEIERLYWEQVVRTDFWDVRLLGSRIRLRGSPYHGLTAYVRRVMFDTWLITVPDDNATKPSSSRFRAPDLERQRAAKRDEDALREEFLARFPDETRRPPDREMAAVLATGTRKAETVRKRIAAWRKAGKIG